MGEKIGVASTKVRMYFIYTSFIAVGSPLIIYLFLAFWINIKNYVRNKRSLIWE
ncbi:MAG: PspC family transcriptional regulator [Saprospiraceae bacterium]|nr:PspC family transcriptional regulator [Saprospiraceae bacterium]